MWTVPHRLVCVNTCSLAGDAVLEDREWNFWEVEPGWRKWIPREGPWRFIAWSHCLVYSLLPDSRSGLGRESSEEPDSRLIKESPDHRLRQRELPGSWLDCLSREGSMSWRLPSDVANFYTVSISTGLSFIVYVMFSSILWGDCITKPFEVLAMCWVGAPRTGEWAWVERGSGCKGIEHVPCPEEITLWWRNASEIDTLDTLNRLQNSDKTRVSGLCPWWSC